MKVIIRETVRVPAVPATPPIPWRREINMPPAEWFRGEWLPAKLERERNIEKHNSDLQKWLRFFAWLITGVGFCGSVLIAYLWMLAVVGTP